MHGILENTIPYDDRIEVWENGQIIAMTGESVAQRDRVLSGNHLAIPFTLPPGGQKEWWLRCEDHWAVDSQWQIWPRAEWFWEEKERAETRFALFWGILLALLLYNAYLATIWPRADTFWYLAYLVAFAALQYLGGNHPLPGAGGFGGPLRDLAVAVCEIATVLGLIQFMRTFLRVGEQAPGLRWAMHAASFSGLSLLLALSPLGTIGKWNLLSELKAYWSILAVLVILVGAVFLVLRRIPQARIFLLAIGVLFSSYLLELFFLFLGRSLPFAAQDLYFAGSLIELGLLSLAMADRLRAARDQAEAIRADYTRHLESDVAVRTEALEKAVESKNRVLAILAHDVRAPLQMARQAMQASPSSSADGSKEILTGLERSLEMVNGLLLRGKLEEDGELRREAVDLSWILPPLLEQFTPLETEKMLHLVLDLDHTGDLWVDPMLIQAVFRNLLSNAYRHTPPRGTLVLESRSAPPQVEFAVRNQCPPPSPELLESLRAGTAPPATQTSGAGLGLSLVRKILALHGHRLEVCYDDEFGGLEFRFSLPLAQPSDA